LKTSIIPVVLAMVFSVVSTALSYPAEDVSIPADRPNPGPVPPEVGGDRHRPGADGEGRPPAGPFRAGGVALERGETYFLHIWLIDTKRIPPALAREMLKENRSLDEIREEMAGSGGFNAALGGMTLGDRHFVLVRINQTLDGNCTILDADLVDFREGQRAGEDRTAGHITVRTCDVDGVPVGCGNLTLHAGGATSYSLTFPSDQMGPERNGAPETAGGEPCPW